LSAFSPSRNLRKVIAGNTDLSAAAVGTEVTEEQFLLLKDYLDTRHHDGGMATMTSIDFAAMAGDTTVATQLVEYRLPPQHRNDPGQLVACALTDVMSDGLSMVYSFYDPDLTARSLGTYMVLHHIERARKSGLPYVYLGYLVEGCRKMSYKARFTPLEAYGADGWKPYDPPG
jgi:arginine-tRNA-protein transferase